MIFGDAEGVARGVDVDLGVGVGVAVAVGVGTGNWISLRAEASSGCSGVSWSGVGFASDNDAGFGAMGEADATVAPPAFIHMTLCGRRDVE